MVDEIVQDPKAAIDWDSPHILSIIVQGALFQGNMIETANHCRHWRELFPEAEIILALSVTDVIFGDLKDGALNNPRLVPAHRHDRHLLEALTVIINSCNKIGLSSDALPLPPIKIDSPKLNNMNFQIAAAQMGLTMVSGKYVLRIRSDMVFLDRSFLDQYTASQMPPRGEATLFTERVLVSWLFTLNPFTVERMPLHISDWFHFGLVDDVRRIWTIPKITLADSLYYRTHPHAPYSNIPERLFNSRLAVEQHLAYHCFKKHFPKLILDYHNDHSSIELCMDILVDNFALCDLVATSCIFEKYAHEFNEHTKRYHCLTRSDWFAMAQSRDVSYRDTLLPKIKEAAASFRYLQECPCTFEAARLRTNDGRFLNGEIIATPTTGVLFFGPYVNFAAGWYLASVNVTYLEGPGALNLRVTTNSGEVLIAEKSFEIELSVVPALSIPFEVGLEGAFNLEVVCIISEIHCMAVSGITISARANNMSELRPGEAGSDSRVEKRSLFKRMFRT